MFKLPVLLTIALATYHTDAALITTYNNCPFTIWPGVYSNPDYPQAVGSGGNGGYQLDAYQTKSFGVPDNWNSGRIWGRRNCDFTKPDTQACEVGSCIGGLGCTQPGIPPVSLAEFTLVPGGEDNYDLSFVDGFNLPIAITPSNTACAAPTCNVDINAQCPASLTVADSNGAAIACKSSCLATGRSDFCCTGSHDTADTCPPNGIPSYSLFHGNCPAAYAYAYDERTGVLKTCNRNGASPDYQVTFCP
ncbi:unnamed protein product [Jaminaea pallidilutea]